MSTYSIDVDQFGNIWSAGTGNNGLGGSDAFLLKYSSAYVLLSTTILGGAGDDAYFNVKYPYAFVNVVGSTSDGKVGPGIVTLSPIPTMTTVRVTTTSRQSTSVTTKTTSTSTRTATSSLVLSTSLVSS